jgi:serine protease inhibitor
MRRIILSLSALASFFVLACQKEVGPGSMLPYDPGPKQVLAALSAADRSLLSSDNSFGFSLFSKLASADASGNILVSPLSVASALTMAYNGAAGTTAKEMASALGYGPLARADVNGLYARLLPALGAADAKVTLRAANSVWLADWIKPEESFLAINQQSFGAQTRTLDFTAAGAVPAINKWVSGQTQALITEIAEAPLDPNLAVMLINALYFKGDWSRTFDAKLTQEAPFHKADGTEKPCLMMQGSGGYRFFETAAVRGLELPYGDSLFSMVFLQPGEGTDLPGLLDSLGAGAWEGWQALFTERSGDIQVPRFKVEYGKSLGDALQAMGMPTAFTTEADFTGILKSGGLRISKVIHKAYVLVDEKGTEAAAVTKVEIVLRSVKRALLRLDRPFLFLIRERNSGAVLFLGRIMDPAP